MSLKGGRSNISAVALESPDTALKDEGVRRDRNITLTVLAQRHNNLRQVTDFE